MAIFLDYIPNLWQYFWISLSKPPASTPYRNRFIPDSTGTHWIDFLCPLSKRTKEITVANLLAFVTAEPKQKQERFMLTNFAER